MAVVPRKRQSGQVVFYAVNEWPGKPGKSKQQSEKVGTSRRQAEVRDRAMKAEIKAGTYQPPAERRGDTLGGFATAWLEARTNASAPDERRSWRLYAAPRAWLTSLLLDDVKPPHLDRLLSELRTERKPDGSRRLSDKTIANLIGVLSLMFNSAVRAERCLRNPVVLEPRALDRAPAVEKEIYSVAELSILMRHNTIPEPVRVLNALCGLGGFREGEACGLRWRDLDLATRPLACLAVSGQYGGQQTKTGRVRRVPVHPALHAILEQWASEGFEIYMRRRPTPEDFIVPNASKRAREAHHTRSSYYKLFIRTAEVAGVRPRSLHALRHTMITMARRGGARKDVLEKVTHNARGDIVDRYTHLDWLPLCEAVLAIDIVAHPSPLGPLESAEDSRALPAAGESALAQECTSDTDNASGSIPGASTLNPQESSHSTNTRQETRQEPGAILASLSAANRKRKRRLLTLAEIDPKGAAPGLAICRALDAQYAGDTETAVGLLEREARRRG